jgi:hypothetical protein
MKLISSLFSWVEIPVTDMKRARKFYEIILEVSIPEMPLGDDLTMAFFPVEQNAIGGALCQQSKFYTPSQNGVTIYLTAEPDIDTMLARVKEAEGTLVMPKKMISPETGSMAMFIDSEGNRIALYEKKK